jgi:molybdopterin converting factor small subunit
LASEEARLAEIANAQQEQVASNNANSKAIKELQARLEREGAKSSDVQVSLMWNNYNDLDLHIVCPSGERIHGGNKISACGGELDVDANVRAETRKPVENVFWPEGTAPGGQYHVYVHYYKKHKKRRSKDPTKFQIMVNNGGDTTEFSAELSAGDPIMQVCSFEVSSQAERERIKRELESELESLTNRFASADMDGSALLSVEELASATGMSVEEAEVIHKQADKDGDGAVSLEEYLEAVNSLPNAPDLESLSNSDPN